MSPQALPAAISVLGPGPPLPPDPASSSSAPSFNLILSVQSHTSSSSSSPSPPYSLHRSYTDLLSLSLTLQMGHPGHPGLQPIRRLLPAEATLDKEAIIDLSNQFLRTLLTLPPPFPTHPHLLSFFQPRPSDPIPSSVLTPHSSSTSTNPPSRPPSRSPSRPPSRPPSRSPSRPPSRTPSRPPSALPSSSSSIPIPIPSASSISAATPPQHPPPPPPSLPSSHSHARSPSPALPRPPSKSPSNPYHRRRSRSVDLRAEAAKDLSRRMAAIGDSDDDTPSKAFLTAEDASEEDRRGRSRIPILPHPLPSPSGSKDLPLPPISPKPRVLPSPTNASIISRLEAFPIPNDSLNPISSGKVSPASFLRPSPSASPIAPPSDIDHPSPSPSPSSSSSKKRSILRGKGSAMGGEVKSQISKLFSGQSQFLRRSRSKSSSREPSDPQALHPAHVDKDHTLSSSSSTAAPLLPPIQSFSGSILESGEIQSPRRRNSDVGNALSPWGDHELSSTSPAPDPHVRSLTPEHGKERRLHRRKMSAGAILVGPDSEDHANHLKLLNGLASLPTPGDRIKSPSISSIPPLSSKISPPRPPSRPAPPPPTSFPQDSSDPDSSSEKASHPPKVIQHPNGKSPQVDTPPESSSKEKLTQPSSPQGQSVQDKEVPKQAPERVCSPITTTTTSSTVPQRPPATPGHDTSLIPSTKSTQPTTSPSSQLAQGSMPTPLRPPPVIRPKSAARYAARTGATVRPSPASGVQGPQEVPAIPGAPLSRRLSRSRRMSGLIMAKKLGQAAPTSEDTLTEELCEAKPENPPEPIDSKEDKPAKRRSTRGSIRRMSRQLNLKDTPIKLTGDLTIKEKDEDTVIPDKAASFSQVDDKSTEEGVEKATEDSMEGERKGKGEEKEERVTNGPDNKIPENDKESSVHDEKPIASNEDKATLNQRVNETSMDKEGEVVKDKEEKEEEKGSHNVDDELDDGEMSSSSFEDDEAVEASKAEEKAIPRTRKVPGRANTGPTFSQLFRNSPIWNDQSLLKGKDDKESPPPVPSLEGRTNLLEKTTVAPLTDTPGAPKPSSLDTLATEQPSKDPSIPIEEKAELTKAPPSLLDRTTSQIPRPSTNSPEPKTRVSATPPPPLKDKPTSLPQPPSKKKAPQGASENDHLVPNGKPGSGSSAPPRRSSSLARGAGPVDPSKNPDGSVNPQSSLHNQAQTPWSLPPGAKSIRSKTMTPPSRTGSPVPMSMRSQRKSNMSIESTSSGEKRFSQERPGGPYHQGDEPTKEKDPMGRARSLSDLRNTQKILSAVAASTRGVQRSPSRGPTPPILPTPSASSSEDSFTPPPTRVKTPQGKESTFSSLIKPAPMHASRSLDILTSTSERKSTLKDDQAGVVKVAASPSPPISTPPVSGSAEEMGTSTSKGVTLTLAQSPEKDLPPPPQNPSPTASVFSIPSASSLVRSFTSSSSSDAVVQGKEEKSGTCKESSITARSSIASTLTINSTITATTIPISSPPSPTQEDMPMLALRISMDRDEETKERGEDEVIRLMLPRDTPFLEMEKAAAEKLVSSGYIKPAKRSIFESVRGKESSAPPLGRHTLIWSDTEGSELCIRGDGAWSMLKASLPSTVLHLRCRARPGKG